MLSHLLYLLKANMWMLLKYIYTTDTVSAEGRIVTCPLINFLQITVDDCNGLLTGRQNELCNNFSVFRKQLIGS